MTLGLKKGEFNCVLSPVCGCDLACVYPNALCLLSFAFTSNGFVKVFSPFQPHIAMALTYTGAPMATAALVPAVAPTTTYAASWTRRATWPAGRGGRDKRRKARADLQQPPHPLSSRKRQWKHLGRSTAARTSLLVPRPQLLSSRQLQRKRWKRRGRWLPRCWVRRRGESR